MDGLLDGYSKFNRAHEILRFVLHMRANSELWPGQDSDVINELQSLRSCSDVRGSQCLINFTVMTIQQTFPLLEGNELWQSVSVCGVFNCGLLSRVGIIAAGLCTHR